MTIETDLTDDSLENVPGLKRKVRELLGETKRQQARIRELEGRKRPEEMTPREKFLEDAGRRLAGLTGEALAAERTKLEAEMVPLIAAEVAEHGKQLAQRGERVRDQIMRLTRENAATQVVMRIRRPGIEPHVLQALVLDRFEVKEEAGEFSVIAKGANGQPVSLDALAEELRAMPALAPLVAGTSPQEKALHAARVAETLGQVRPNGAAR